MILESIFYGNFSPVEQVYPEDPEYREALKSIEVLMQQLSQKLPPEDYQMVEEILSHYGTAQCIEDEAHFKLGFSAGLTLQQEVVDTLQLSK